MNVNYKIHNLGNKAETYFKDRFNAPLTITSFIDGKPSLIENLPNGQTLSIFLKKNIRLNEGKIITYAPSSLTGERLLIFDLAFLKPSIPPVTVVELDNTIVNEWLVNEIKSFLAQSKDNYCIFEDGDAFPSEKIIARFPFKNVLFKRELYYILDNKDSDEVILEAIVQNSSYWPLGMGIFTTIKHISSYFSDKDHIKSEEFFEIAAKNTQKIYIQAYDAEGYVLWEKNNNNNSK